MSQIKNGGLDQYGAGPFEQQQFGTAGVEGVNCWCTAVSVDWRIQGDAKVVVDSYKLSNVKMAKRLWQIAVEHHAFFR